MVTNEIHRLCRRTATVSMLVAAVVTASVVSRPAAGQSPEGTRITTISVENQSGDSTVVSVLFDGPITSHRWSHIGGDAPRAVVKIGGIVEAYRPYELAVEDDRVHRVRIGHHPEFNPPEEHLVFDLIDDRVAITGVVKQDRRLIVTLATTEASVGTRPPTPRPPSPNAPAPTPASTATTTSTPTPTPRSDPTATATPAIPTPTNAAPPTAVPAGPTAVDRRVAPTTTAPIPDPREGLSGPLLTELVISHRNDGSALVRVSADGRLEGSDLRFFAVRVPPPRNLLVIPGARLPGEDALLPIRDGLLCEIGVAFTDEGGPARTELTFHLASTGVSFEQAAVKGNHAVIHLRPPVGSGTPLRCEIESPTQTRRWRFEEKGPPLEESATDAPALERHDRD
jgi:hypothetical protein